MLQKDQDKGVNGMIDLIPSLAKLKNKKAKEHIKYCPECISMINALYIYLQDLIKNDQVIQKNLNLLINHIDTNNKGEM